MSSEKILTTVERLNNYLNKIEVALTELHRVYDEGVFRITRRVLVDGLELLEEHKSIFSEYVNVLSAVVYWMLLCNDVLESRGIKPGIDVELLKRIKRSKMLGESYDEAQENLDTLRRYFAELQKAYDRYCREVGLSVA